MIVYLIVYDNNLISHDEAFYDRKDAEKCLNDYVETDKQFAILRGILEEDYQSYYSIHELKVI